MVSAVQALAVKNMVFGEQSFGQSFVQTAQLSAGPSFELQFFNTQNAVLDQLNNEIDNIQKGINTKGATALLNVKIAKLEDLGKAMSAYKDTTDKKANKIEAALEYITELEGLASAGTVADFDAKLALLHQTLEKAPSPTFERFGTPDRFRSTKFAALSTIEGLNHNNFATQQDIDDTLATLSAMKTSLNTTKAIVDINADIAYGQQSSNQGKILELRAAIFEIETSAQSAATKEITEKQEYYSQVLTVISLAFDASQEFTNFISQSTNFEKKPEPGSVLNLFS